FLRRTAAAAESSPAAERMTSWQRISTPHRRTSTAQLGRGGLAFETTPYRCSAIPIGRFQGHGGLAPRTTRDSLRHERLPFRRASESTHQMHAMDAPVNAFNAKSFLRKASWRRVPKQAFGSGTSKDTARTVIAPQAVAWFDPSFPSVESA